MTQYLVTITVDEDTLKQAYVEGHDISAEDCPDTESVSLPRAKATRL